MVKLNIEEFFNSNKWNVLKEKVKKTVKAHFKLLKERNPDLCGYAFLPGQTYEVESLYSVSCNKSDFEGNFSFCPDEWSNWHKEYNDVTPFIKKLNTEFSSIHQSNPDDFCMDDTEVALIKKFHDTFLSALHELKTEQLFVSSNGEIFVLIWLSDTSLEGVINHSVVKLNSVDKVHAFNSELNE